MFMKKKILIPYATYGNGHKAIAEYIKKYFEENGEYECKTLDLISYSLPILGTATKKCNDFLMTKLPSVWSLIYYAFDNKLSAYISSGLSLKIFDNKHLRNIIQDYNPDITIATHFWGTDIINKYNKKGLTNSKIVTIVTDYKSHDVWLKSLKGIDAIIVSSFEERIHLLHKGFKNKQIFTSGIPICPKETDNADKEELRKKFKIQNKKKTVLFFAGGGNGALLNLIYFKEILKNDYDCNVLFIAGKNKTAEKRAKEYVERYGRKNVKIYGFVNNVNEFYQVSDFVITKPRGAQVTECLYYERPMILIKSNGGQEIENRRYLVKKGYAKSVMGKSSFNKNFKELLENDKARNKMIKNISNIEQRKSMQKLFKIVEKL